MFAQLTHLLQDPPPAMAFEISEAGIATARIGSRAELDFHAFRNGTLSASPLKENVNDPDDFMAAVRAVAGPQTARRRKDAALILPDYSTRITVVDFDNFPNDAKEQLSLVKFRVKRSVPFDVDSASISYFPQHPVGKRVDVVVVLSPLEIVARYESPFRAVGLTPGFVTTSGLAALDLVPDEGLNVVAKLSGRVLTVLVRDKSILKLVRCIEVPSNSLDDVAAVLAPTFVFVEDNLGGRASHLLLCGFGAQTAEAQRRFAEELSVHTDVVRSPMGTPGESNAGLLGYLRSIARNN